MSHRTSLQDPGSAGPDLRPGAQHLRAFPMPALAELHCRATLGSFSTLVVAVISALALVAAQSGS
jgi:hypothetical protein